MATDNKQNVSDRAKELLADPHQRIAFDPCGTSRIAGNRQLTDANKKRQ